MRRISSILNSLIGSKSIETDFELLRECEIFFVNPIFYDKISVFSGQESLLGFPALLSCEKLICMFVKRRHRLIFAIKIVLSKVTILIVKKI